MAQKITMFKANDGSIHATAEKADARDAAIDAVAKAMRPLGPRPDDAGCRFSNGHGFRQHDPETVAEVKRALIEMTRERLSDWMKGLADAELERTHPSWFCRMLDGGCPPLESAWSRMCCIDAMGREWGQPYYAAHPDAATAVAV